MRRLWVVSYDVADARRRQHLANYLLGWGDRVLESVYECVWRADQLPQVQRELAALIDAGTDRLWLVPVCCHCRALARVNGQRRSVEHCGYHVV
jgi:CRISPR-associated protein Cas2